VSPRALVLFDGAGFARLGLEQAGWDCVGVELDPWKHVLGESIGRGQTILGDVVEVVDDLLPEVDAVWASPPCQWLSGARTQGVPTSPYAADLLDWSLALPAPILWVENVIPAWTGVRREGDHGVLTKPGMGWCSVYNAAQFTPEPRQNRNRCFGGHFPAPPVYRPYKRTFPKVCPTVTASEYKGCATDVRRASRYYGRRLKLEEAAWLQGLDQIPPPWFELGEELVATKTLSPYGVGTKTEPHVLCDGSGCMECEAGRIEVPVGRRRSWTPGRWRRNMYEAIGNAVPVYMARAFGEAGIAALEGR